jgi:hypothetical protein
MLMQEIRKKRPARKLPPVIIPHGTPNISAVKVAEMLNVSRKWVLELAKRGVENGGLQGWIQPRNGEGWMQKTGETGSRQKVFFIKEDVERWIENNPIPQETDLSHIEVPAELRALIEHIAAPELAASGAVTRTRVRDVLIKEHGYSDRVYIKIMKVAQDEGWKLPKHQTHNTAARRRGRAHPKRTKGQ